MRAADAAVDPFIEREQVHQKKWTVVALLWGAIMIVHFIRVALGVVAPTLMRTYHIPPLTMGYVLSGWNWAYTGALIFAGPIVDRWGPWMVMGIGSGVWSLATLALPIGTSIAFLFAMRGLFGFGHSMLMPAQALAVSQWFGPKQRATALGFCFSGGMVGLAMGTTVAAVVLDRFGWAAVFYGFGGASLLFAVLWLALYPDRQRSHGVRVRTESHSGVSLLSLLRHRSTWGIAMGQFGYLYAYYFFLTWLPSYFMLERKMSVLKTGFVASLPFWMGVIGTIGGGLLGDYLIRRGFSTTASRKGIIGVGMSLATAAVVWAAFATQTWLAVTLLTLCMGFMRTTTGSGNSLPIDLAPPGAVGSLTSIQNFAGNIGGLLAPIVTGYIVQSTGSLLMGLVVAGMMIMFAAFSYILIVGRLEPIEIA